MNFEPSPKQALALVSLLFGQSPEEREPMVSKLRPELKPRERKALVDAGFLELERRGRATHVVATERCWDWAASNLGTKLMPSKFATQALENVLSHLGEFLQHGGIPLAKFMMARGELEAAEGAAPEGSPAESTETIAGHLAPVERIRRVALDLADGVAKRRVRLADLRRRLPELSKDELDALLLDMQQQGQLVLYRLDNPRELSQGDHEAALLIAGNPRHLVYLEA